MKKKLFIILSIIFIFSFSISFAKDISKTTMMDEVKMCAYEDLGNIAPFAVSSDLQYEAVRLVFDSLYYIDEDQKARPMLSDNLKISDDFMEYRIAIKNDLKWHDGTKVEDQDVINSFNEAKNTQWYKKNLTSLKKISKQDGEIVFEMKYPNPIFMEQAISYIPIVKKSADEIYIGSGPFRFNGRIENQFSFENNTNYHMQTTTKKLIIDILDSSQQCAEKILNSEYVTSFGSLLPFDFLRFNFRNNEAVSVYGLKTNVLFLNNNTFPFNKTELRQAISHVIDFDKIVNDIYKKEADKGNPGFYSSRVAFSNNEKKYENNLEKAKEILNSSGYVLDNGILKDGSGKNMEVILKAKNGIDEEIAQLIKANLLEIGINVNIEILDRKDIYKDVKSGSYSMAIMELESFYQSYETGLFYLLNEEYSNYGLNGIEEIKNNYIASSANTQERLQNILKIQNEIAQNLPFITLCNPREISGVSRKFDIYAYKKGVGIYSNLSFIENKKYYAKMQNANIKRETEGFETKSIVFVIAAVIISLAGYYIYNFSKKKK